MKERFWITLKENLNPKIHQVAFLEVKVYALISKLQKNFITTLRELTKISIILSWNWIGWLPKWNRRVNGEIEVIPAQQMNTLLPSIGLELSKSNYQNWKRRNSLKVTKNPNLNGNNNLEVLPLDHKRRFTDWYWRILLQNYQMLSHQKRLLLRKNWVPNTQILLMLPEMAQGQMEPTDQSKTP